jgi:hypothetical protein
MHHSFGQQSGATARFLLKICLDVALLSVAHKGGEPEGALGDPEPEPLRLLVEGLLSPAIPCESLKHCDCQLQTPP